MALRKIILNGDPALNKMSRPVVNFDKRLHVLLDDMIETLKDANGVGLAAPQIGVLRRVVVIDDDGEIIELINPEIISTEGKQDGPEGCLSYPGVYGMVQRPRKVKIRARNRVGGKFEMEREELLARAFCHEVDHLDGKMFTTLVSRYLRENEEAEDRK